MALWLGTQFLFALIKRMNFLSFEYALHRDLQCLLPVPTQIPVTVT